MHIIEIAVEIIGGIAALAIAFWVIERLADGVRWVREILRLAIVGADYEEQQERERREREVQP